MHRLLGVLCALWLLIACSVSGEGFDMPSQYNGQGANLSVPATVNISSSTNANPSVVQTSTNHNLTSGDIVDIQGHQTNTAINGQRVVTVVDATHFIVAVAANGVGGATGTVAPQTMGQTFQIPSAGDRRAAAGVNVGFQALADRTAALGVWTGAYKLTSVQDIVIDDSGFLTTQWSIVVGSQNVWTLANAKIGTISNVQATDVLDLSFVSSMVTPSATAIAWLSLATVAYAPGATPGAATRIPGSGQVYNPDSANIADMPVSLQSALNPVGTTGNVDVWLMGAVSGGTVGTILVTKNAMLKARVWRPTTMPQ